LVSWDPYLFNLVHYLTCGGILLTCYVIATKREIISLNIYGLCMECKRFWNHLVDSGLLTIKNLVVAGDLNLTVSTEEVWGRSSNSGSLPGFFRAFFQAHRLIDV
jgi:hypothetical protein